MDAHEHMRDNHADEVGNYRATCNHLDEVIEELLAVQGYTTSHIIKTLVQRAIDSISI
jgi:hypothetical protein